MVQPSPTWPGPEVKQRRKLPCGVTGNALRQRPRGGDRSLRHSGSGSAYYQDQDSARQDGQEAPAAVQLETDAKPVYRSGWHSGIPGLRGSVVTGTFAKGTAEIACAGYGLRP